MPPSARPGDRLFRSFWMGGFEGADHVNSRGQRLDLQGSNGHRDMLREDYERVARFGIRTIRESIGWRISESTGSLETDPPLQQLRRMAGMAADAGLQVIWTIHHYGLPEGIDFFSDTFAVRFADFCDRVARVLSGLSEDSTVYQPVNEISFLSWAAGTTSLMHPYQGGDSARGYDLKCRLVQAALLGCDAIWATDPSARIVHTDPLIHVVPAANAPDETTAERWRGEALALGMEQYQAWDMLCGRLEPGLGGAPRYLDVLGLNYYHSNQWEHPGDARLYWHLNDPRRKDLADLLDDVWQRYQRPLFIAETGHVGDGRGPWLDDIAQAALRCHERGTPLEGICLYPLVDRTDWEEPDRWHRSGLWDVHARPLPPSNAERDEGETIADSRHVFSRVLHAPLADRLLHWQRVLNGAPSSVDDAAAGVTPAADGAIESFGSHLDAEAERPLHLSRLAQALPSPFTFHPPSQGHAMTTLIVFSHLRWDFVYQRPQQLLSRLADRFQVVFVEEPITSANHATLERLHPCRGVEVLRPHLPGNAPGFHDEHIPHLRSLIAGYLDSRGIDDYLLWFYTPMATPLAADLEPCAVIYDCMDELSAFRNAPRQLLQRENMLFKFADLVFTGGQSLYEAKRLRHDQVHCFPSSVDADHYSRAIDSGVQDHPAQAAIPRPRLGYFGVIDERVDLDLIASLADAHGEWQVVMVGPVVKIDPATLPQRPNLYWLGQRSYEELPDLIAGWDVCLLPFALNESTRYISPTKTLEYLAAGKPVVSTPIRDVVTPYGDQGVVAIAASHDEFARACERALARNAQDALHHKALREQVLAGISWDHTVARMIDLIESVRDRQTAEQSPLAEQNGAPTAPARQRSAARTATGRFDGTAPASAVA